MYQDEKQYKCLIKQLLTGCLAVILNTRAQFVNYFNQREYLYFAFDIDIIKIVWSSYFCNFRIKFVIFATLFQFNISSLKAFVFHKGTSPNQSKIDSFANADKILFEN